MTTTTTTPPSDGWRLGGRGGKQRLIPDPTTGELRAYQRSLDRIDNDGPYSPDNCRWATAIEQRHNQRPHQIKRPRQGEASSTARLTWDAVRHIRSSDLPGNELAAKYGVSTSAISMVRVGKTWKESA